MWNSFGANAVWKLSNIIIQVSKETRHRERTALNCTGSYGLDLEQRSPDSVKKTWFLGRTNHLTSFGFMFFLWKLILISSSSLVYREDLPYILVTGCCHNEHTEDEHKWDNWEVFFFTLQTIKNTRSKK